MCHLPSPGAPSPASPAASILAWWSHGLSNSIHLASNSSFLLLCLWYHYSPYPQDRNIRTTWEPCSSAPISPICPSMPPIPSFTHLLTKHPGYQAVLGSGPLPWAGPPGQPRPWGCEEAGSKPGSSTSAGNPHVALGKSIASSSSAL